MTVLHTMCTSTCLKEHFVIHIASSLAFSSKQIDFLKKISSSHSVCTFNPLGMQCLWKFFLQFLISIFIISFSLHFHCHLLLLLLFCLFVFCYISFLTVLSDNKNENKASKQAAKTIKKEKYFFPKICISVSYPICYYLYMVQCTIILQPSIHFVVYAQSVVTVNSECSFHLYLIESHQYFEKVKCCMFSCNKQSIINQSTAGSL